MQAEVRMSCSMSLVKGVFLAERLCDGHIRGEEIRSSKEGFQHCGGRLLPPEGLLCTKCHEMGDT